MANTTFDVIAIGDTTQDVFLQMSEASLQCDRDGKNCRLCFDYAEKIPVDKKTDVPAVGNAPNLALGVARLGGRAAMYTIVGDDVPGKLAVDVFKESGVAVDYVYFDKDHGTNLSTIINYQSERTIFVFHEPRQYDLPDLAPTQWIYLTSVSGGGVERLHADVLAYLDSHPQVKMAFNPGTYQMKLGTPELLPLLERTELLFLNREEAARLLETSTKDIKALLAGFHQRGVRLMVLTDGPAGAYASDGTTIWQLDIFRGPVVERTGCGDAFGSGVLGALIAGKELPAAMLWGNANATSVVRYIGGREGLLTRAAVEQMIAEQSDIVPKKFSSI